MTLTFKKRAEVCSAAWRGAAAQMARLHLHIIPPHFVSQIPPALREIVRLVLCGQGSCAGNLSDSFWRLIMSKREQRRQRGYVSVCHTEQHTD